MNLLCCFQVSRVAAAPNLPHMSTMTGREIWVVENNPHSALQTTHDSIDLELGIDVHRCKIRLVAGHNSFLHRFDTARRVRFPISAPSPMRGQ
jgi:hypothetical protein